LHFDVNNVPMLLVFPAPDRCMSRLFPARDDSSQSWHPSH
jgi:hypothetical protein